MRNYLWSLVIAMSCTAVYAGERPNYIVVRVAANSGKVDVVPLTENFPSVDETTAPTIAAVADENCTVLQDEAVAAYRRIARNPSREDIKQIREAACSFDTSCQTRSWQYNKTLGRFNVSADGACAPTPGRGLHAYFPSLPSSGQYPNIYVPSFGAWYLGIYNPYRWFNYVFFTGGYWYYFYGAPWLF